MKTTNILKKWAFYISLLLISTNIKAQDALDYQKGLPSYVPASPTVASLMQYADCPVSYYTGVPEIAVPLYEIDIDGYKLPITLSYHASGIRADQEASWVGLGWSLHAGGAISRTVKCADDFLEYHQPEGYTQGYYSGPEVENPSTDLFQPTLNGSFIQYKLKTDSEADIFNYCFPQYSGKFLLDKARGAVLLNKADNLKIEVLDDATKNKKYFVLTTPDGVRYEFKGLETTASYQRSGSLNRNLPDATKFDETEDALNELYETPQIYTSGWHLTKITTVNGREIIFNYVEESHLGVTQEHCKYYNLFSSSGDISGPANGIQYTCSKTVSSCLRLGSIVWDYGNIVFDSSSRDDVSGIFGETAPQKLDIMKVMDKNQNIIKNIQFGYDYFNKNYSGIYQQVFKRLKLITLTDSLIPGNHYTFTYNEGELPPKNTRNTDYWGYYNGIEQGSEYYSPTIRGGIVYSGADKTPRLAKMKLGSLASIGYPTGLETKFTYETNMYFPSGGSSTGTSTQTISGSQTVYKYHSDDFYDYLPSYRADTIVVDNNTSLLVWGYAESMSCITDPDVMYGDTAFPVFQISKLGTGSNRTVKHAYTLPEELAGESCSADFGRTTLTLTAGTYIVESFAIAKDVWLSFSWMYEKTGNAGSTTGGEIAGGGLRISTIEAGDKIRHFSYSTGTLLVEPVNCYTTTFNATTPYLAITGTTTFLVQTSESVIPMFSFKSNNSIGYHEVTESVRTGNGVASNCYKYHCSAEYPTDEYPFLPVETNYYNGLPESVTYFRGEEPVKRVNYEYESVYSHYIYGFMHDMRLGVVYPYSYRVETPYVTKETITDYADNGEKTITTEKEYGYNERLQVISESTGYYQTKTIYPTDCTDTVSLKMQERNMINLPKEVIQLKYGSVIQGKKVEYKDTLNLLLPVSEYALETRHPLPVTDYQNNYVLSKAYRHYNSCAKPTQVDVKDFSTVYLWSYNGMYPIAEIRNAGYAEVVGCLGSSFINGLPGKSVPSNADYASIDTLRDRLPHAQVYTYVYSPLKGIVKITDPRGLSIYYTYDEGGRLTESYLMINGNKQILEHYDYHYKE